MTGTQATTARSDGETAVLAEQPRRSPRRPWVRAVAVVVVVLAVGVPVAYVLGVGPFHRTTPATSGVVDNAAATSTATVARRDLSSQTQVNATLGYAGSYSVINQTRGVVTALPATGRVVRQGEVLYRVDGSPVVLLYGSTPAYRSLAEGQEASDVTGRDVAELNADLVALGYATHDQIPAGSDEFSWQTKDALEKLQAHLGLDQTGKLTLGQAIFLPTEARVTTISATLGSPAQPGQPVLTATSTARQVTIRLDAAQQSEVKVGDTVTITLPDNTTTPGVVSSVGKVATSGSGSGSSPTVSVQVTPTHPAATGSLDQAPVTVSITTASVKNALVVPINALLALAGGGYAVEVVDTSTTAGQTSSADTHRLVPVSLGLFDDASGLVAVTGSGLSVGQHVVVPST